MSSKRRKALQPPSPTTRARSHPIPDGRSTDAARARGSSAAWLALTTQTDAPGDGREGAGHPLDSSTRSRMERALGGDLADARVHTDGDAARAADEQGASAFTVGSHVTFAAGEYRPGTLAGDALLAHELAHVQQQRGATAGDPVPAVASDSPALEADASRAAVGAVRGAAGGWLARLSGGVATAGARMTSGLRISRCKKAKPWEASPVEETLYEQGDIEAPIGDLTPPDSAALKALGFWTTLHMEDTKEEILDHVAALNSGDSFVFFGHGAEAPSNPGVALGINPAKGKTILPADLEGALARDQDPPSLVMLSGCGSGSLLKGITDAGVPVAVGFSKQINAPSGAAATIAFLRAIHDGKTFGEAQEEANKISTGGDTSLFDIEGMKGQQLRTGLLNFASTIVVYREGYGPGMTLKQVQEDHKQEIWKQKNPSGRAE